VTFLVALMLFLALNDWEALAPPSVASSLSFSGLHVPMEWRSDPWIFDVVLSFVSHQH
jgi:hypothetical protein